MGDAVTFVFAVADVLRQTAVVRIVRQQLLEQLRAAQDVLAGLLEQLEVGSVTRGEHLCDPRHPPHLMGLPGVRGALFSVA